jgi:hypothetical protein
MSDDTDAATLCARLEAIVKKAEDGEAQAVVASRPPASSSRRSPRSPALEQTATAARQRVPSSSSLSSFLTAASQLVPTVSSTYEDTVIAELHLQVPAVLNVRQLVNIVLDSSTN